MLHQTTSRKCGYADDLAIAIQHKDLTTAGLSTFGAYFRDWRLKQNMSKKPNLVVFILQIPTELRMYFKGTVLNHNPTPKYFGIIQDRTLTNTAVILGTRSNSFHKLPTWGVATLRTLSLSIV